MPNEFDLFESKNKSEAFQFSIPKILVAVLLFMLFAAVAYNYFEKERFKSSIHYLNEKNKQTEKNLNTITEKYNLSNDDNKNLQKELTNEYENTKKYKDSFNINKKKETKDLLKSK